MLLKYSRIKQKEQSEYLTRLKDYYAEKVRRDGRPPVASPPPLAHRRHHRLPSL